jgi:hypothetical protein
VISKATDVKNIASLNQEFTPASKKLILNMDNDFIDNIEGLIFQNWLMVSSLYFFLSDKFLR